MKGQAPLIVAVLVAPLLALGVFLLVQQRDRAALVEYHEAAAAYRAYLWIEQQKVVTEERDFETKAQQAEREAFTKGGQSEQNMARIRHNSERERRRLSREIDQIQKSLAGPPPAEWTRLQSAARRAAMPLALDDAP